MKPVCSEASETAPCEVWARDSLTIVVPIRLKRMNETISWSFFQNYMPMTTPFLQAREWLGFTLCTTQTFTCTNSHENHGTFFVNVIKISSCHLGVWWKPNVWGQYIYFCIISESFWLLQIQRIWSCLRPCGQDLSSSDPEETGEPTTSSSLRREVYSPRHSGLNISVPIDQHFVPL